LTARKQKWKQKKSEESGVFVRAHDAILREQVWGSRNPKE
jgi:hypothetical protein